MAHIWGHDDLILAVIFMHFMPFLPSMELTRLASFSLMTSTSLGVLVGPSLDHDLRRSLFILSFVGWYLPHGTWRDYFYPIRRTRLAEA